MENAYDVAAAFHRIEDDLIKSMIRNFEHHKAMEAAEGIEWTQWQVEQLAALEEFKRRNRTKYAKEFRDINESIERIILHAKQIGMDDQEMQILNAVKRGARLTKGSMTGEFFKINDRKVNAMIQATVDHTKEAEVSILRVAEDKYRQTIFNAQMYASTGGTYEKAVDMATKDFLAAGIQCIRYKNNTYHSLEEYSEMALRTANTRAYLTGEGEMRNAWGEHLVIMNKRNCACPKCLKWLGRVLVDDVWSGGSAKDGNYPLMSTAIGEGLYHPNCKDIHTTYFADVLDDLDDDGNEIVKEEEKQEVVEAERKAQEYNRAAEMEKRNRRLAKYSLDPDNRRAAAAQADAWQKRKESLPKPEERPIEKKLALKQEQVQKADFVPAKTIEEAQEYAKQFVNQTGYLDKTFKGAVDYKGISLEHANAINSALTKVYTDFPELDKLSGIKTVTPNSKLGRKAFNGSGDSVFSYSPAQQGIFINADVVKNAKAFEVYKNRSADAWKTVKDNIDSLSGASRELADRYIKAGRSLVAGDSIEDLFIHELGHHAQWTLFDPKTQNIISSRMSMFAEKISGYATSNRSEYFAESFVAYMKGEKNLLDPEYVKFLNGRIIRKSS